MFASQFRRTLYPSDLTIYSRGPVTGRTKPIQRATGLPSHEDGAPAPPEGLGYVRRRTHSRWAEGEGVNEH